MPQLRQNIITGDWVVIAPERAKRPHDFIRPESNLKPHSPSSCPFCEESSSYKDRLLELDSQFTYTIPNKFPAFVHDGSHEVRSYYPEGTFYQAKPAVGNHEVIVVTDPAVSLFSFTDDIWADLLTTIQGRYQHYRRDPHTEYILAIYNHGHEAGASIDHPHAQLFAADIVPDYIVKEIHGSERYYDLNSQCVYCDMLKHEQKEQVRIIAENEDFLMFTFFAARFPFEIWVAPKKHQSSYEQTSKQELTSFANILRSGFGMLNSTLHNPALNFYLHSLPTTHDDADYYHWHLEIAPRLALYAGFELGSGTIIDIVSPEKAAEFLRSSPKTD